MFFGCSEVIGLPEAYGDMFLEAVAVFLKGIVYLKKYPVSFAQLLREKGFLEHQVAAGIVGNKDMSAVVHDLSSCGWDFTGKGEGSRFSHDCGDSLIADYLYTHKPHSAEYSEQHDQSHYKNRPYGI